MTLLQSDVLDEVTQALRVTRRRRSAITRELRAHLEETRRDLVLSGWPPQDAEREAAARLGDTSEIAAAFGEVYRPARRTQLGLAIALSTGMLLGAYGLGGSLASATAVHHARPAHVNHAHR